MKYKNHIDIVKTLILAHEIMNVNFVLKELELIQKTINNMKRIYIEVKKVKKFGKWYNTDKILTILHSEYIDTDLIFYLDEKGEII